MVFVGSVLNLTSDPRTKMALLEMIHRKLVSQRHNITRSLRKGGMR